MAIRILAIWAMIMFLLMGCGKHKDELIIKGAGPNGTDLHAKIVARTKDTMTLQPDNLATADSKCLDNEHVVYNGSTHELKCVAGTEAWSTITSADAGTAIYNTVPSQVTDQQRISLLRDKAKQLGLHWTISCWTDDADVRKPFIGSAWRIGESDDSEHDRWLETEATQALTAEHLYIAIQGPPTHPKKDKDKVQEIVHRRICPMPLHD